MKQGLQLAFAGTVLYSTLFMTIRYVTVKKLSNKYQRHDCLDVANKLVSSVHAIFSSVAGLIITLNCKGDIKYDRHWMTNGFAWFGFPYFLYDVYCMFYVYQSHPDNEGKPTLPLFWKFLCDKPVIVAHHFILAFLGLPTIVHYRRGLGDYFLGCFYLAELSTPFVSFRAILSKLNMKKTTIYKVNGILMIILFFFCRVCLFPYLYYSYAVYANITVLQVFTNIPIKCNVSSALFVFFQLYWFRLMVAGAWKLFWSKRVTRSTQSIKLD